MRIRRRFFSSSIRSHVLLFIIMMGLTALILVMSTAWAFRHFSWESQQLAFSRLAELEVADLLGELGNNSADLAIRLQHSEAFRDAFRLGDTYSLTQQLNDQFRQYYHTAGIIRILKLQVLNLELQPVAESTEGESSLLPGVHICPSLMQKAAQREGGERLKPVSALCLMDGEPHYAVLAPIGGLRLGGYVLVASDPAPVLAQLENELGASIHLLDANGESRYRSADHEHDTSTVCLPVHYQILTDDGELAYQVDIDVDITGFDQQTRRVFGIVLSISVAVTLLAMLLAIYVFRRSTILPMETLSSHLERIRGNSDLLGQQLKVDGNREVRRLSDSFNEMSKALASMQSRLSTLAYTDTLTGAANRLIFNSELEKLTDNNHRGDAGFALFIIDLNKFKEINDEHGHDIGDALLKLVVRRMGEVLRDNDLIARLGGDEFGIILPGLVSNPNASRVAQKILDRVQEPAMVREITLKPALSIGVSFYPETTISREALLKAADHAMYQAKLAGGGFHIAPPCPDQCERCKGEILH